MYRHIAEKIREIHGIGQVLTEEPMQRHTTFRIGGPADVFCAPETEEALRETIGLCRDAGIPWYIIGNGSNLLVSDEGYRGVIVQLYKNFNRMEIHGDLSRNDGNLFHDCGCEAEDAGDPAPWIYAQAGAMLAAIARRAAEWSLTGLEFASGIPGTLGGAVVMNAGAYGGEMKQVVKSVRVLTKDGDFLDIPGADMAFGYRSSRAQKEDAVILSAVLSLAEGDPKAIRDRMEELRIQRTSKQPLDLPSAGSTFKRPEGYFAGKLIMDAGLRGFRVGDAMVSEKHCGFVVNTGEASAAQVRELMDRVREKVFAQFGVMLEPEVKMLGF